MQPECEPRPQHYGMRVVVGDAKTHEKIATDLPADPDVPDSSPPATSGAAPFPARRPPPCCPVLREEHAALVQGTVPPNAKLMRLCTLMLSGFPRNVYPSWRADRAPRIGGSRSDIPYNPFCRSDEPALGGGEFTSPASASAVRPDCSLQRRGGPSLRRHPVLWLAGQPWPDGGVRHRLDK